LDVAEATTAENSESLHVSKIEDDVDEQTEEEEEEKEEEVVVEEEERAGEGVTDGTLDFDSKETREGDPGGGIPIPTEEEDCPSTAPVPEHNPLEESTEELPMTGNDTELDIVSSPADDGTRYVINS
jgi:hypothetical protein